MNRQNTLSSMFSIEALPQYSLVGINIRLLSELSRNDIFIFYSAFNEATGDGCVVAEFCPVKLIAKRSEQNLQLNDSVTQKEYAAQLASLALECGVHMRHKPLKGIARVKDFIRANNTGYIVYDIKEAQPLSAAPSGMDMGVLKGQTGDMLFSLSQLHSESVYHTAISPECVFVDGRGAAQLAGFAESAALNNGKCLLQKGNCTTMLDKNKTADEVTFSVADAYSAAALFYDKLGGNLAPYNAKAQEPQRNIEEINRSVDKPAAEAIMAALAPQTHDRFALNRLLSGIFGVSLPVAEQQKRSPVKKKSKLPKLLTAAALILVGGVLGVLGFLNIKGNSESNTDSEVSTLVPVPNVIGMTDAEAAVAFKDWNFITTGAEQTDAVPVGCIMSQSPVYGTLVEPNSNVVSIVVNRGIEGPREYVMPYVVASSLDEAYNLLESAGASRGNITIEYDYDGSMQAGIIVRSLPEYGADITADSTVLLTVSLGGLLDKVDIDWSESENSDDPDIILELGQTLQLGYKLSPANVVEEDVEIKWSTYLPDSGNPIITVDNYGNITATGVGKTPVTVEASTVNKITGALISKTASRSVQVKEKVEEQDLVTPKPTATPTPVPTPTAKPTATPTPKPGTTATPVPSVTPAPTPTPTPTPMPTPTPTPTPTPVPTVSFNNDTFESEYRKYAVEKGWLASQHDPITQSVIDASTSLMLNNGNLSNISDAAKFKNATEMSFQGSRGIRDIGSLSGLAKLIKLYLDDTGITSLDALNSLNLNMLQIYGTSITLEQIQAYKLAHPNCTIYSDYGDF